MLAPFRRQFNGNSGNRAHLEGAIVICVMVDVTETGQFEFTEVVFHSMVVPLGDRTNFIVNDVLTAERADMNCRQSKPGCFANSVLLRISRSSKQ